MSKKQKLELTWVGKEDRPRLEPRILIEDSSLSHHAAARREGDVFDNMLIQGDNLLALRALQQDFAGKVKCVFIDPPYNTGSAFAHYDDGLEHSIWLSLMRDRIQIIRELVSEDGSLWITIDDNESHYLKVLCDEVFGRPNFVANVIWQKKYSKQNDAKHFSTSHDHILVYAKDKSLFSLNQLERNESQLKGYANPDNDPRGLWTSVVYTCAKTRAERPNLYYPIAHPKTGAEVWPSETRVWGYDPARHKQHVEDNMLWWGRSLEQEKPRIKVFLSKVGTGVVPDTIWLRDDAGDNQDARREALALNEKDTFSTAKPEKLLKQIISVATNPGDLVLDSFSGSGTTGAVAHKMGRRWIMIELGNHAITHCLPRLKKVIDGADAGGITESMKWQGGGGFRFYRLAPSLLTKDRFNNWIIAKQYNPAMLAEAMCKLMGFTYAPSLEPEAYWQHGHSTETDFIYVTTQSLTHDALRKLSEEVGSKRTLLVCCKAFSGREASFPNLTIKKIPQVVLTKCEWGRDDYSLRVANLPVVDDGPVETSADDAEEPPVTASRKRGRPRKADTGVASLFAELALDPEEA